MAGQLVLTQRQPDPGAEVRRHRLVDDRRRDADDADPQAATLDDAGRLEDEVVRLLIEAVDGEEWVRELPCKASEMGRTVGEVPVGRHPVQCQGIQDRHEGLPLGADDGIGPVEGVAVVEGDNGAAPLLP